MTSRYLARVLTALVIIVILAAGWFAYQPALSGSFLLDDVSNLGDLEHVDDRASALQFVLSGTAGPVGRPIALASFLPQAHQWEQGAGAFLAVNIVIHLLNACLLGSFLYLLTRARGIGSAGSRSVALTGMALWLLMPLLASSTLLVVQRMTTLSATFVFLGLNVYLLARSSIERNGRKALWVMSLALVVATLLAVLTKESGALLPVLVLVIEATLLSSPTGLSVMRWRAWMAVFLALPTAFILGYVASRLPYSESLVLRRDFTGWERLLTESRILWEYLANAFIPRPGQYGPFHDAFPVAAANPFTFVAAIAWLVAIALAIVWRRKYRLYAFAVLWFVGGHLLESTTIALELYFEHRNYVPIVGPVYSVCSLIVTIPVRYQRILAAALPLYILVNAFFLFNLASLYGNPAYAARYWYERFPDSSRSATAVATRQLDTGEPGTAIRTLNEFADRHPEHAYVRIPALNLSCIVAPDSDHRDFVRTVRAALPAMAFSYQVSNMLSDLLTTASRIQCDGVDVRTVESLSQAVISNPRYRNNTGYRQLHHQILARIERQRGAIDDTLAELNAAIEIAPSPRLNMMMVTTLVSVGRFDEARRFIDQAWEEPPIHPLRRVLWKISLNELRTYVDETERTSRSAGAGTR